MTCLPFPDIDPVAVTIGPLLIRWYALSYLAGFVGGWVYGGWLADRDPDRRPNREDIDNILPWLVLGVILGGRLGYELFYVLPYMPESLMADPWQVFRIWEGGMSFHGGLLGVVVAIVSYSLYHKFNPLAMGDIVSTVVPIGLFFGRLANFANGELFGRPTTVAWSVCFPHGGEDVPRHPSQLYEAGLEGLLLGAVLFFLARNPNIRRKPGILFGTLLVGYGLCRAFVEYFREPDLQVGLIFEYVTMGQLLCLPMIIAGVIVIQYARTKATAKKES